MRFVSWIIFILLIGIEGTITTLPVTLLFLLCLTVMKRQEWIFFVAFAAGLLLDTFSMRTLGVSSLFFVSYIFLVLLYQRKYETATMQFVVMASFIGSIWYLAIIGAHAIFLQALISAAICAVAFAYYQSTKKTGLHDGFQRI